MIGIKKKKSAKRLWIQQTWPDPTSLTLCRWMGGDCRWASHVIVQYKNLILEEGGAGTVIRLLPSRFLCVIRDNDRQGCRI